MNTSGENNPEKNDNPLDMQIGVIKTCLKSIERSKKRTLESKQEEFISAVNAGKALVCCKEVLGHSNWLPWLEQNFGMSDKTANNYMNLFRKKEQVSDLVSDERITLSMLYILSTLDENDLKPASEEIRTHAGHSLSVTYVWEIKRKAQGKPGKNQKNSRAQRISSSPNCTDSGSSNETPTENAGEAETSTSAEVITVSGAMRVMIDELKLREDETNEEVVKRALTIASDQHRKSRTPPSVSSLFPVMGAE